MSILSEIIDISPSEGSLLALFGLLQSHLSSGFVTSIGLSYISIGSGYTYKVSPNEAIFLGIIYFKIYLLRYLGLLPISLNHVTGKLHFFDHPPVPSSFNTELTIRRRREIDGEEKVPYLTEGKAKMAETMLGILRRLDTDDCFLRTLCELQVHQLRFNNCEDKPSPEIVKISPEIQNALTNLFKLSTLRKQLNLKKEEEEVEGVIPETIEDRPIITVFEEAVEVAWISTNSSSTDCSQRYSLCHLSREELFEHYDTAEEFLKF